MSLNLEDWWEHYKKNWIEPIEVLYKNFNYDQFMWFCLWNVFKYITRYKDKWTPLKDLEKAKHYLEFAIEREKAKDNPEE